MLGGWMDWRAIALSGLSVRDYDYCAILVHGRRFAITDVRSVKTEFCKGSAELKILTLGAHERKYQSAMY
jgi:hypothetical protein